MFRRPRAREPARAGVSEGSRSAADAPAGPGGQPSAPTLAHQWTLELGQRPEHVEHQAAAAVVVSIEATHTAEPVALITVFGLGVATAVRYIHAAHPDRFPSDPITP